MEERNHIIKRLLGRDDVTHLVKSYDYHFHGRETYVDSLCTDIYHIIVLPDDIIAIVNNYNNDISIYDITNRTQITNLVCHIDTVNVITKLSNGDLVTGSMDKTVRIWDNKTYKCHTVINCDATITCISVMPDDSILISTTNDLSRWSDKKRTIISKEAINQIHVIDQDHILVRLSYSMSCIINLITTVMVSLYNDYPMRNNHIVIYDKIISSRGNGSITIYKSTGEYIITMEDIYCTSAISLSNNLLLLSVFDDNLITLDLTTYTITDSYHVDFDKDAIALRFGPMKIITKLPNGNIVITMSDKLYIYDISERSMTTYNGKQYKSLGLYEISDNRLLDISDTGNMIIRD